MIVTPVVVGPSTVATSVVAPSVVGAPDAVTFTFPESSVFAITRINLRNGFIGGSMSRAAFGVTQSGTAYGVDFLHEGSGADCRDNTSFTGVTRGQATLSDGARSASDVAAAAVTALQALGVTGVSQDGADVTVAGGSVRVLGSAMSVDHETTRGMHGVARAGFGGAPSDPSFQAATGPIVSVHIDGPAAAGRIIGVYTIDARGASDFRMGIADGPAYSTTPAAFSNGVEGIAVDNSNLRLLKLATPMARGASAHKWISFTSTVTNTVGARLHSDSPTGQGNLTTSEQILSNDNGVNDPSVAIYTAGAYTHANELGPFSVYSQVGYIYETPVAGEYPADGGIEARIGYHGAFDNGSPTTAGPSVLEDLTETFRIEVPWDVDLISIREALADNAADEDSGLGIYDFNLVTLTALPFTENAPLLLDHGRFFASSGAGYKTAALATPLAITAGDIIGPLIDHGNDDGVTPATTITTNYDAPGTAGAYLSGWGSQAEGLQNAEWSDMADADTVAPANAQYITLGTGDMPVGDPGGAKADPFDTDATDLLPGNQFRIAMHVRRGGMT